MRRPGVAVLAEGLSGLRKGFGANHGEVRESRDAYNLFTRDDFTNVLIAPG